MNRDLALIMSIRRVFRLIKGGSGVSHALASELGVDDERGRRAVGKLLLGYPTQSALYELRDGSSEELGILSTLIEGAKTSSSGLIGEAGEDLSLTLEGWMKEKENLKMEDKVMGFRSLFASAILGGMMAMIATIGPLVGSISFTAPLAHQNSEALLAGALAMSSISSGMLGLFTARKRVILNLGTSTLVFVIVASLAGPLASVQASGLLGVK